MDIWVPWTSTRSGQLGPEVTMMLLQHPAKVLMPSPRKQAVELERAAYPRGHWWLNPPRNLRCNAETPLGASGSVARLHLRRIAS
mmetsp:Transcript_17196/g.37896  ORF Transcript_17196/g.37896 Transcript_17196/m.37896 type:complete len:85 (+) Transcript_17196:1827-2081(+)